MGIKEEGGDDYKTGITKGKEQRESDSRIAKDERTIKESSE